MAKVGRPAKSPHLKLITGNPGKRPIRVDEPELATEIPDPPVELTAEAVTEWHRVTAELAKCDRITTLDRAALAGYCQSWADWLRERAKIAETGTVLTMRNEKGEIKGSMISPHVQIALKMLEKIKMFAAELNLTAAKTGTASKASKEPSLKEFLRSG